MKVYVLDSIRYIAQISSFKMYMVYDAMRVNDGQIYDAQKYIGTRGGVIGVHCENYDVLQARIAEEKAKGHMDPTAHPVTRPQAVEAEGVARLMRIAELSGYPAWVVHLSTADGLEEVRRARKRGVKVFHKRRNTGFYRTVIVVFEFLSFSGARTEQRSAAMY